VQTSFYLFGFYFLYQVVITQKRAHCDRLYFFSKILLEIASSPRYLFFVKLSVCFLLVRYYIWDRKESTGEDIHIYPIFRRSTWNFMGFDWNLLFWLFLYTLSIRFFVFWGRTAFRLISFRWSLRPGTRSRLNFPFLWPIFFRMFSLSFLPRIKNTSLLLSFYLVINYKFATHSIKNNI